MAGPIRKVMFSLLGAMVVFALFYGWFLKDDASKLDQGFLDDFSAEITGISSTCDLEMNTEVLDSFAEYAMSDIHTEYDEEFFQNSKLIRIENIHASASSVLSFERLFFDEDSLIVLYQMEGVETSPYCFEILIEVNQSVKTDLIHPLEIHTMTFLSEEGQSITLYAHQDGVEYLELKKDSLSYLGKGTYAAENEIVTLGNVCFEGYSTETYVLVVDFSSPSEASFVFEENTYLLDNSSSE